MQSDGDDDRDRHRPPVLTLGGPQPGRHPRTLRRLPRGVAEGGEVVAYGAGELRGGTGDGAAAAAEEFLQAGELVVHGA